MDAFAQIPDNSVDAIVTDPPYGLEFMGKDWDAPWKTDRRQTFDGTLKDDRQSPFTRQKVRYGNGASYGADGPGPMQLFQEWNLRWALEAFRVLKPGGHIVCFSGSRTYHRTASAIEDAGFEIRDQIMWLYGTGFPKGRDIEWAIWKESITCLSKNSVKHAVQVSKSVLLQSPGAKEIIVAAPALIQPEGEKALIITTGRAEDSNEKTAIFLLDDLTANTSLNIGFLWNSLSVASSDPRKMFTTSTESATTIDLKTWKFFQKAITLSDTIQGETSVGGQQFPAVNVVRISSEEPSNTCVIPTLTVQGPATFPAVKSARGFNVSIKPAHEPVVLARKPLQGTVAANVLKHGTGGLNIDGCRVPTEGEEIKAGLSDPNNRKGVVGTDLGITRADKEKFQQAQLESLERANQLGRFPANVIHDGSDEVEAAFAAFGQRPGQLAKAKTSGEAKTNAIYGNFNHVAGSSENPRNDSGTASRFFAKAPFETEEFAEAQKFFYSAKAKKSERAGSKHPTVKPIALMRYLTRLVTPPGGTVLDPFAGSGTTGQAAVEEGFNVILMERETEYCDDIEYRIARMGDKAEFEAKDAPARPEPTEPAEATASEAA